MFETDKGGKELIKSDTFPKRKVALRKFFSSQNLLADSVIKFTD